MNYDEKIDKLQSQLIDVLKDQKKYIKDIAELKEQMNKYECRTCNALLSHMNEKGRPDEHGIGMIKEVLREHIEAHRRIEEDDIGRWWKSLDKLLEKLDGAGSARQTEEMKCIHGYPYIDCAECYKFKEEYQKEKPSEPIWGELSEKLKENSQKLINTSDPLYEGMVYHKYKDLLDVLPKGHLLVEKADLEWLFKLVHDRLVDIYAGNHEGWKEAIEVFNEKKEKYLGDK